MASLNTILNPESSYEPSLRLQAVRSPSSAATSPTEKTSESSNVVELKAPPRADVATRTHEPHPDCPDTLACLPDTDGRPQHTLPVILRCTILGSPRKRLTIREIYAAMERKYPYYKTAGPAWKQSVRHHLSLNRLFERQPRPPSDPGFGSYWIVNLDAPPGTKRPRKRGGRATKVDTAEVGGIIHGLGPISPNTVIPLYVNPQRSYSMVIPPVPPPPHSATPSTSSTVMSPSPNTASTSSGITSTSLRPPPPPSMHPMSQPPLHEDHSPLHYSPSSHSHRDHYRRHTPPPPPPPHMLAQSPHTQPPPPPHPQALSHSHTQLVSHHHPHPHPQQHSHTVGTPHGHPLPPSRPLPHSHSQPPPPSYGHTSTQLPQHAQSGSTPPPHQHQHSQSQPHSHPHSHSSHQHPHPHPHAHQHPSSSTNSHPSSVSTIAKLRPVDSRSFSQPSNLRNRRAYDDDDDDEMDWEDDPDGLQYSDDDYASSEDMPYQYDPRAHNRGSNSYSGSSHRSYSGSQGQNGRSVLHGAFSSYAAMDHADSTIERLKMEMAGLRRQSQDAVNASLRLSDQLNASQQEVAQAKAALKIAENMREEEARRRIQAEQNLEEEARRRRAAEDTLRQYQVQAQRKPSSYSRP